VRVRLNPEWAQLLERYQREHRDRRNELTHLVGIPMIAASLPLAITIVGLPVALGLWTVGWGLQFAGHWFEGNDPAFFRDRRNLIVGVIWWAQKAGLITIERGDAIA
jgi:uncharacterized membrane protein YGL010W